MNNPVNHGCIVEIVVFDFATKTLERPPAASAQLAMEQGKFAWIDLEYTDGHAARDFLSGLGTFDEKTIEHIFNNEASTHLSRFPDHLHLLLSACRFDPSGRLLLERIDAVITQHSLITIHQQPHFVIDIIKGEYQSDFTDFAQTPSFLIYELWDALIEHYAETQKQLEYKVEQLQIELFQTSDDSVFGRVAEIGENLLHLRGVLMPARTVLTELATRRTNLISEATQTALNNMTGTLERILQDVLVDREILTQSLSLHMSMLSHRTNQAMSKLTVVSLIFLPLTFLVGIYGMNFAVFPEIKWHYGYLFFWIVCITIVAILLIILRRNRML